LAQTILSSQQADPILATCQSGLGRSVAFTSSVDSRWAANWLQWPGFERFWEQTVRWAAKPAQSTDCEVFADIQGRQVTINVEALDAEGKFLQLAHLDGQVIAPDASAKPLELTQIGPGQYRGQFQAPASGSYLVNLRYRIIGEAAKTRLANTTVTIPFAPEFRDLSDNAPLLKQVSDISGGRILSSDPNQAGLFDRSTVKFPETHLPLTRRLILIWLALFLLDVAVRRVALDVRAMARWALASVRSLRAEGKADRTLERLRLTRQKLREQLFARSTDTVASRRYEAKAEFKGDLPTAEVQRKSEPPREKGPAKPAPAATEAAEEPSHIQQLLKAKRKAADRRRDGKTENET
jgi:hypothetical protein